MVVVAVVVVVVMLSIPSLTDPRTFSLTLFAKDLTNRSPQFQKIVDEFNYCEQTNERFIVFREVSAPLFCLIYNIAMRFSHSARSVSTQFIRRFDFMV
jgi:hypothetical protein